MKQNKLIIIILSSAMFLGCTYQNNNQNFSNTSIVEPTSSHETTLPPAMTNSVLSSAEHPISTATLTPVEVEQTLLQWLQHGENCLPPCFLGISKGQTQLEDAIKNVERFGVPLKHSIINGQEIYYSTIQIREVPRIHLEFTVKDNYVDAIHARVGGDYPEKNKWLAYSPEQILKKNGTPDRVEFFSNSNPGAQKDPGYSLQIYYDNINLVILYYYALFDPSTSSMICPTTDQFKYFDLWLGDPFDSSQSRGKPLQDVTGLSLDEFYKLLLEDSHSACFDLDVQALLS